MPPVLDTACPLLPDAQLVRRMAGRDTTALAELQQRYTTALYAIAYGILADARQAERVVGDVFEQAWHAAGGAPGWSSGPAAWLRELTRERARRVRLACAGAGPYFGGW